MSIARPNKKACNRQPAVQQPRRQYIDRQLFTLQYLNHTMDYILQDNKSLDHYLEVDQPALEKLIKKNGKDLGLHFVQRVKFMKEQCEEDLFVKDLQQYGDFINYDLPKSYQRDLISIENQLNQEIQTALATKRLKRFYPTLPARMTSSQVQTFNRRMKQDILNSLINNYQMIPEEPDLLLERNYLYRQMFSITTYRKEESIDIERPYQRYHQKDLRNRSASAAGIANKMRSGQSKRHDRQKKCGDKNERSRKIVKVAKKLDSNGNEPEEYFPKPIKKSNKIQDFPLIIDRPILQNPYSQQIKRQNPLSNFAVQNQTFRIEQQNEGQLNTLPKPIQRSEEINDFFNEADMKQVSSIEKNEGSKLKMDISEPRIQLNQVKRQLSDVKKEGSEVKMEDSYVVSNPQQKIKRKYNKTPKDGQQDKDSKGTKMAKKEKAEKQKLGQINKKQDSNKNKVKKIEQPKFSVGDAVDSQQFINKTKPQIAFVSIAIQTNNEQTNQMSQIQEPKQPPQILEESKEKYIQKSNIIPYQQIQQAIQQASIMRNKATNSRNDIQKQSRSYQCGVCGVPQDNRRDGAQMPMDHELQQRQHVIQNPIIEENNEPQLNQQRKSQNSPDKAVLDISEYLN